MEIIVYGAGHCNPCRRTKAHLDSKGKKYTYKDITEEQNAEELKAMGFNSIPLVVCGDVKISGFNPEALDKL